MSAKSQINIVKITLTKYPPLANLVKRILCVPVTSAAVERVFTFSHGGIVVRPYRLSLAPQRLHKILFLKCNNMYLMRQNYFKSVCAKNFFIFVLHDQLLAKNAHRAWIQASKKLF